MADRYREIDVAGSCQVMGQQIGEAAREEIRGFAATSYDRIAQTIGVPRQKLLEIVAQSTVFTEKYAPDLLQELQGMSEGSNVPFDDLMFLQIRNQLTAEMDSGCTSVSVGRSLSANHGPLIGQNWDNDPTLDRFTVVLTRRPAGKPAFITVTQAGLIAYIGFSDAGIAACLNSLPAPSRPVGVPHYFTLRRIFESRTLDEAVSAVASAHRAIPANIMLATPQGPADLEVTVDSLLVLRPGELEVLTHTNHCLHPDLAPINERFDELIQSRPRLSRIDRLLGTAGHRSIDVETLKTALRDHDGFPRSLCRHANDDPQHGFWETVFSVIMAPESGELQLTRGKPCETEYESYRLQGVADQAS